MNKKVMLAIIPLLVLVVAGIGVLGFMLLSSPSSEDLYLERITSAQKFLESGDIDQAILYYKRAIEADDQKEEPYLALARIYYDRKGDLVNALNILYQGRSKINTQGIQQLIDYYEAIQAQNSTSSIGVIIKGTGDSTHDGYINNSYAEMFSSYSYADYKSKYSVQDESRQYGVYSVVFTQIDGVFEYANTYGVESVLDPTTGEPYPEARPTSIRLNRLSDLIYGTETGVSHEKLADYGVQSLTLNEPGSEITTYYLSFVYKNCRYLIECTEAGVINNPNGYNRVIPTAADISREVTLSGSILNAADSSYVSSATLNIRKGKNVQTGSVYRTVHAVDGRYSVDLEPNQYTIEVIADGFITEFFDVTVSKDGGNAVQSFVISPELGKNQMRFVVEWTDPNYDLYIHIHGYSSDNQIVDYWEYSYSSSEEIDKNLGGFDRGYNSGKKFTSATITDSEGSYEFHVHGGADQYQPQDILNAGAVVKIYKDNNAVPVTVDVPSSFRTAGYYWVVCSVQNGNITILDR